MCLVILCNSRQLSASTAIVPVFPELPRNCKSVFSVSHDDMETFSKILNSTNRTPLFNNIYRQAVIIAVQIGSQDLFYG